MNYFLENWGNFVGALGLIITLLGLIVSFLAFKRAGKARDAAEAAEAASRETRSTITRSLTTVELERAIALVQRLKDLHRANKWETSLEHYQPLRVTLAEIRSRHLNLTSELRQTLDDAILNVTTMENDVSTAVRENVGLAELRAFERTLNDIQRELVVISSSINSLAMPEGK